jgi:16S rRNA (cytidine1402-2'-O)-methyltransferase
LEDLALTCGGSRRVAVARELTKLHEEFFRGTLEEAAGYYGDHPPRGEVTVVVAPGDASQRSRDDVEKEARILAARLLEEGLKPSAAAREVTVHLDLPRNVAYRIVHEVAKP